MQEDMKEKAVRYDRLIGEVVTKLKKLCVKKLSARRKAFLSKKSINCRNRVIEKGGVSCSILNSKACHDGIASGCSYFDCRNTREGVDRDFFRIIRNPIACGKAYPKIAILLWFLHISRGEADDITDEIQNGNGHKNEGRVVSRNENEDCVVGEGTKSTILVSNGSEDSDKK